MSSAADEAAEPGELEVSPASPTRPPPQTATRSAGRITWSARILAATRAAESLHPSPLVVDPLAAVFANPPSLSCASPTLLHSRPVQLHHAHFIYRRLPPHASDSAVHSLHTAVSQLTADSLSRPDTLIRCRYMDELLQSHCAEQHCPPLQLVLLGAGLDARAHRLRCLQSVRVYEVDVQEMLQWKRAVLQQMQPQPPLMAQSVEYVCGDLSRATDGEEERAEEGEAGSRRREKEEAQLNLRKRRDRRALRAINRQRRTAHSSSPPCRPSPSESPSCASPPWAAALLCSSTFSPSLRTVWLLEGVAMYLSPSQLSSLLADIAALCPARSVLCFDLCTSSLGRWHRLFRCPMSPQQAVQMVEKTGQWKVGERRRGEGAAAASSHDGYAPGDGVVGIGKDELSYGRYLCDVMRAVGKNGREEEAQSFIVTAERL